MGVTTGGMAVSVLPGSKFWGDIPKIAILRKCYKYLPKFSYFPIFSKYGGQNLRRKLNLGVGGFDSPESVPQSEYIPPSQNFVAMPLI